jgi:hypothetical protein
MLVFQHSKLSAYSTTSSRDSLAHYAREPKRLFLTQRLSIPRVCDLSHAVTLANPLGAGRPPLPEEVRQKFLSAWGEGKTYAKACETAGVANTTPQVWRETSPEFAAAYDRARSSRAARMADDALDLADSLPEDATSTAIKRAALRIGARHWLAERSSRDFASRSEANHNVQTSVTVRLEGGEAYVPSKRSLNSLQEAEIVTAPAPLRELPASDAIAIAPAPKGGIVP